MPRPAPARRPPRHRAAPRLGLALGGGGAWGAIYEIGALCALEESITGLDLTRCDGYVGVSAGGFVAAALANGIGPRALCRSFIENDGPPGDVFDPALLMQLDGGGIARSLGRLPGLAAQAVLERARRRPAATPMLARLGRALPTGLFSNHAVHAHLGRVFAAPGRSNDFRTLGRRLVLVAVDLDSGELRPFGLPGHDHVPISLAVQASAALPGLFPPVAIDGRRYVDGVLRKTLHASVLLDEGLDLLFALNPLVPYDGSAGAARLADGGLPQVLSQSLRTLIRSRLALGLRQYGQRYPDTDVLLVEPDAHDATVFFANPFGYAQRRQLAEHAYRTTRAQLRARRAALGARLARHGLGWSPALDDAARTLLPEPAARGERRTAAALRRLAATLDRLDGALAARAA